MLLFMRAMVAGKNRRCKTAGGAFLDEHRGMIENPTNTIPRIGGEEHQWAATITIS